MTTARTQQIYIEDTPYYHCISRCVRRAFLCGDDPVSGKNFEHRKHWIVNKIQQLSSVFTIDVCAYSVMSNHYHLVLHVDQKLNSTLSNNDVIDRWTELFNGNKTTDKYREGKSLTSSEELHTLELITTWRTRLGDISWLMRCLNESVARQANREDQCTGRFWEGRFKSQALLDETALLACMMYVDLNPVRAGSAETVEKSHFTSIKERIDAYSKKVPTQQLLPFDEELTGEELKVEEKESYTKKISFSTKDYIELIKWSAKEIRHNKEVNNKTKGQVKTNAQLSLKKLGVNEENWLSHIQHFEKHFYRIVGPPKRLKEISDKLGLWWIRGSSNCRKLYSEATT